MEIHNSGEITINNHRSAKDFFWVGLFLTLGVGLGAGAICVVIGIAKNLSNP